MSEIQRAFWLWVIRKISVLEYYTYAMKSRKEWFERNINDFLSFCEQNLDGFDSKELKNFLLAGLKQKQEASDE